LTSFNAKVALVALFLCTLVTWAQATDSRLFGTWSQEGPVEAVWTFRPDGSGFMEQVNPRTTARFTWSCQGQRLNVSAAGGLTVPYTVLSNDGNFLVIRNDQVSTVYRLKKKN
jgi:hypothetical protein